MKPGHDALDSLIYLHRTLPLDLVESRLGELFGYEDENEDVAELIKTLKATRHAIRREMERHHDGRTCYSTGVPFERVYLYIAAEPGEDGEDVPAIQDVYAQLQPDGTPFPLPPGAVWADEVSRDPEDDGDE